MEYEIAELVVGGIAFLAVLGFIVYVISIIGND